MDEVRAIQPVELAVGFVLGLLISVGLLWLGGWHAGRRRYYWGLNG